jgi:hypothetical protein
MTKNKLSDLNDHLFAQIERLSDEELEPDGIEREAKRGEAIVAVADRIIENAGLKLRAAKILADAGQDPSRLLGIDEKQTPTAIEDKKKP